MALIKLGALAQDVRGSIAGTTFSKSRAGSTTRQKVSPVQPGTIRQLLARSIATVVSQGFRALTGAEQAAWGTWSNAHTVPNRFGDPMKLAPNAAFMRINADLLNVAEVIDDPADMGLTLPLSLPPADSIVAPAAGLSAAAVSSTGVITITTEAQVAATGFYAVWCSGGVSQGVQFIGNKYRMAGAAAVVAAATTVVITPADVNERITFADGDRVSCLIVRYSPEGMIVDVTRLDCTAAA